MRFYDYLKAEKPTKLGCFEHLGYHWLVWEHPVYGEDSPMIIACEELKEAKTSDTYDYDIYELKSSVNELMGTLNV